MKFRTTVVAAALLAAAAGSDALTLGRARGAAVLGQPLDLQFEVRLDPGDEAGCIGADVLHADAPVDASRVRVSVAPAPAGQDTLVRVRSNALVDEPVVAVVLRAGCTQRAQRRYVLLADLPTDTAATAASANGRFNPIALPAAQPALPAWPPAMTGSARGRDAEMADGAAAPVARPPFRPAAVPKAAAAAPRPLGPRIAAAPAPARPRLQLDPADLAIEGDALLRPTFELPTLSAENPARRAEAAALWRALNADPADVLRETQRVQQLEMELKALRDQSARTQGTLAQAQQQSQAAQAQRYANPLVYVLAGLLVLLLALCAWLWRRGAGRSNRHWWQNSGVPAHSGTPTAVLRDEGPVSVLPHATASGYTINEVDLDLSDSMLAPLAAAPAARPVVAAGKPVAATAAAAARSVHPEELFDVQQQADFFVSLGQYDQAIGVLQKHIDEAPSRSPLAYLDLLKIFHTLSRSDDYQRVRLQFNALFNAEVPESAAFNRPGEGLDAYGDAVERLQAAWGTPDSLAAVEALMFRQPGSEEPAFALEAYRDLMLLHGIAKTFAPRGHAGAGFNEAGLPMFSESRPAVLSPAPLSASPLRVGEPGLDWPSQFPPLEPRAPEPPAPRPVPVAGTPDVPLDLDLDLDDLPVQLRKSSPRREPEELAAHPVLARMLPDDPSMPSEVAPAMPVDSHLIDFDLFDTGSTGAGGLKKDGGS